MRECLSCIVLHKELTFCRRCRNALKIVTCTLKLRQSLGNELWEESLLVLVKEYNYNRDMGEEKI